jgi:transcriptional regulator with XRE-family HTH domain
MIMNDNFEARRRAAGLTLAALSRQSGVSYRTLQDWHSGARKASDAYMLRSVSRVLGCSIEDILDDDGVPVPERQPPNGLYAVRRAEPGNVGDFASALVLAPDDGEAELLVRFAFKDAGFVRLNVDAVDMEKPRIVVQRLCDALDDATPAKEKQQKRR